MSGEDPKVIVRGVVKTFEVRRQRAVVKQGRIADELIYFRLR